MTRNETATIEKEATPILSGRDGTRECPDWFQDQQREAWMQFESLPKPTRKDQAWRFANVGLLDLSPFKSGGMLTEKERATILEQSCGLEEVAGRIVFAGDELLERDVISDQLKKRGVIFQPLERAIGEHADLFRKYFMAQPATLGSTKFAALHHALVSSGTFLYVPRGVEIELPIETLRWLNGENDSALPHLLLVSNELAKATVDEHQEEFDARTLQDHVSPHTASDLLYKNALDDRARTIFGGLIRVEPHAHFTDAYQKVRNLLLSDDAEANSMPGLEILADNVRCTHGATSGQVDEDELFYLRTRGIPVPVAQRLIVTGFLDEVVQRLDHPAISEHLHRLIEDKFSENRG